MIRVNASGIPTELKERRQWVVWKNKIPLQPNGVPAKSNDSSTWVSFDEVMEAYTRGGFDGIGYVFSEDDPFCGIDLDGCYHPRDGVDGWAQEIIDRLDSYSEVSPSGSGVKIIVRGKSPFPTGKRLSLPQFGGEGGREAGIEIYDHGRYFCVTGEPVPGTSPNTECRELDWLQGKFWPESGKPPAPAGSNPTVQTIRPSEPAPPPWERPSLQPAAQPVAPAQPIAPVQHDSDTLRRASLYLAQCDPAIQGQGGHDKLLWAAVAMVHGFLLSDSQAIELLIREYNPRCVPPWDLSIPQEDRDFRRKVTEARKLTPQKPPGWLLNDPTYSPEGANNLMNKTDIERLVANSMRQPQSQTQSETDTAIVFASEYLTRQPPPVDAIIPELIDRGDKFFIVGQSKLGKSFFALQMALCLASGRPFLGWMPSRRQKILLIQFELKPTNYWRRVRYGSGACGITADDLGDWLHIRNLRGKLFALDKLEVDGYDLVVVDPFYKLTDRMGVDENSAKEVASVLGCLDALAERGPAVCIVHHGTKGRIGDKQAIDRASGSGVIARDFDGMLTLSPHQDHPGEWLVLETILRNYRSPKAMTIEFCDGLFVVRKDVPPQVETSMTAKRSKQAGPSIEELTVTVRTWITDTMKTTDVTDRIKSKFGVGRDKANGVIRQLERDGCVRDKSKTCPAYATIAPPVPEALTSSVPPTQGVFNDMR